MKQFGNFSALGWLIVVGQVTYFSADAQGSKITDNVGGKPWNVTEYLHVHGIYPSKTKIYRVQVIMIINLIRGEANMPA